MRKPDFTATTITASPAKPLEGDVVSFTVSMRNSGDEDAPGTIVRLNFPLEGMFIDLAGLETQTLDRDEREAQAMVDLPAGAAREFHFRVIAPRDSAGHLLIPRLSMQHFSSRTEHFDSATVDIGSRIGGDGVAIGAYRITTAGLVTLALLISIPVLWLILRLMMGRGPRPTPPGGMRAGPFAAVFAIVVAIGFWTIFGAMALRDYRSLSWPEASCEILDRKLTVNSSTSSGSGGRAGSTYATLLALRYLVDGKEMYSTGFDTGSRLTVGGGGQDFKNFEIGSRLPCWYAPEEPADVVVKRGFGGAYIFALLPLPVFLIGLWMVRSLVAPRS